MLLTLILDSQSLFRDENINRLESQETNSPLMDGGGPVVSYQVEECYFRHPASADFWNGSVPPKGVLGCNHVAGETLFQAAFSYVDIDREYASPRTTWRDLPPEISLTLM